MATDVIESKELDGIAITGKMREVYGENLVREILLTKYMNKLIQDQKKKGNAIDINKIVEKTREYRQDVTKDREEGRHSSWYTWNKVGTTIIKTALGAATSFDLEAGISFGAYGSIGFNPGALAKEVATPLIEGYEEWYKDEAKLEGERLQFDQATQTLTKNSLEEFRQIMTSEDVDVQKGLNQLYKSELLIDFENKDSKKASNIINSSPQVRVFIGEPIINAIQPDGTALITDKVRAEISAQIQNKYNEISNLIGTHTEYLIQISQDQKTIIDWINNEPLRKQREAEMAALNSAYAATLGNIGGTIESVSTIIGLIDRDAGKAMAAVGGAAFTIATSINQFANNMSTIAAAGGKLLGLAGAMGGAVMTGNIAAAIVGLIGAFASGPTPEQLILEEVQALRKDVHNLHTAMNKHFENVYEKLNDIHESIEENFQIVQFQLNKINRDMDEARASLIDLTIQVVRMTNYIRILEQDANSQEFFETINTVMPRLNGDMSEEEFFRFENALHVWATQHSLNHVYGGGTEFPDTRDERLFETLQLSLDINTNYLNAWLRTHGQSEFAPQPVANYGIWILASRAYTALLLGWPNHALTVLGQYSPERQTEVLLVGEYLRQALQRITTLETPELDLESIRQGVKNNFKQIAPRVKSNTERVFITQKTNTTPIKSLAVQQRTRSLNRFRLPSLQDAQNIREAPAAVRDALLRTFGSRANTKLFNFLLDNYMAKVNDLLSAIGAIDDESINEFKLAHPKDDLIAQGYIRNIQNHPQAPANLVDAIPHNRLILAFLDNNQDAINMDIKGKWDYWKTEIENWPVHKIPTAPTTLESPDDYHVETEPVNVQTGRASVTLTVFLPGGDFKISVMGPEERRRAYEDSDSRNISFGGQKEALENALNRTPIPDNRDEVNQRLLVNREVLRATLSAVTTPIVQLITLDGAKYAIRSFVQLGLPNLWGSSDTLPLLLNSGNESLIESHDAVSIFEFSTTDAGAGVDPRIEIRARAQSKKNLLSRLLTDYVKTIADTSSDLPEPLESALLFLEAASRCIIWKPGTLSCKNEISARRSPWQKSLEMYRITPGTQYVFDGFTYDGESVNGDSVWYRIGKPQKYAWVSRFEVSAKFD